MNVLFITHYSLLYGANRSMIDLIDGLARYNVTPFVVIPEEGAIESALSERNIQYKILPVPFWVSHRKASNYRKMHLLRQLMETNKSYRKMVTGWSIDIIYTNTSISPIGKLVAFQTRKPHIWHIRELLDLHYSYQFIFPRWLSIAAISTSKAVICNSNAVKNHYFAQNRKNIHVIYNGIASEKIFSSLRSELHESQLTHEFVFSIVGVINPKKGQDIAIRAVAELIKRNLPVQLIIAGDGNDKYQQECRNFAEQLKINDRVEFTGYVNNPNEIYQRSSCLLVCSEYEAMGRVTIEGMAACLPVIAKNSGGTPEIMVQGKTGFLYDTFDELVDYMARLVKDPALCHEMGLRGWEFAKERFTTEKYTESIYKIIRSIAK